MHDVIRKLTSRKFLLSLAAFLGSIGATISGMQTGNESVAMVGVVCAALSAAIYAGAEAMVDAARAENENGSSRDYRDVLEGLDDDFDEVEYLPEGED